MRELIIQTLRVLVKQYPEIVDMLNTPADRLLIEDELLMWEGAVLENRKSHCHHIPDGLVDKVNEMLGYAKTPNEIKMVFSDVLTFFKQEGGDDPRARHEKIPPRHSNWNYEPGKTQLEEKDIEQAINRWDKIMPQFKGMLNARVTRSDEDNG